MVDRETGDRNREKNGQGASGAAGCSPVIEKGLTEKNSHALFVNFDGLDQMSEREKRKKFGDMDIVIQALRAFMAPCCWHAGSRKRCHTDIRSLFWKKPKSRRGLSGRYRRPHRPESPMTAVHILFRKKVLQECIFCRKAAFSQGFGIWENWQVSD